MSLRNFYTSVVVNETAAMQYLQTLGVLPGAPKTICDKQRNGVQCGGNLRIVKKRFRSAKIGTAAEFQEILRCAAKGCQTFHSIRQGNAFFHSSSSLMIREILEIVYYWSFLEDVKDLGI